MRTSRWVLCTYAIVILCGILVALPNLLSAPQLAALPDWLPKRQVTLGLDLRGGAHMVLELDGGTLREIWLDGLPDEARNLLRDTAVRPLSVEREGNAVVVTLAGPVDRAPALAALRDLAATGVAIAEEGGRIRLEPTETGLKERLDRALAQSLEVVRRRVDQVGVAEPTIQRIGLDRILVQLPGLQDSSQLRALLGSTAMLSFHMLAGEGVVDGPAAGRAPPGARILPDESGTRHYLVKARAAVSGERLSGAQAGFDPRTGKPMVSFTLDGAGARQFATITSQNVGRPFAIVLDGKVLSAPVIREPILGGSGQISGGFTFEEAGLLAAMLRAGALPAPLTVIEERSVGPDLGSDAVAMGVQAGLAGFLLVALFMLARYGGWGLIANLALACNVALVFAALGILGATLTLPGIAGLILGVGLAVDANILINERIREEARKGVSALKALDTGFRRAYATIIDANVTTLMATTLLFAFGSGPVRGFAITMMLGIGISMFTAIAVVRVLMTWAVVRQRLKTLRIRPLLPLVPENTAIRFMRARFFGIALSVLLSLASIGLFVQPGLNYGIDFKGGIQMELAGVGAADLPVLRQALSQPGPTGSGAGQGSASLGSVGLQAFGDGSGVLVKAENPAGGPAAQAGAVVRMRQAIAEAAPQAVVERVEAVGPKISGELASSGIWALGFACLAMLGYIWWRFEWHFAVGAIATLALDVTKVVGFFALTGLEFNLAAIAALLTIIGYSVNDKVVVYDRMRENMRLFKAMPLREVIDRSINQTLARCLLTSATTALAILPMAFWGGPAVASFAWPMLFGVAIATASSIFIAAPILLFLGDWRSRLRAGRPAAGAGTAGSEAPS